MLWGTYLVPIMEEADKTNPFAKIQILLRTNFFPTMAEADKTNPFATIQMLLGTDGVPTIRGRQEQTLLL